MKRLIAAGALGVVATLVASAPALAAPPESAEAMFEDGSCGFPLQVTITGKVKFIEHGDRIITTGPAQRATLVNASTGQSISLNIAGAFHDEVLPGGGFVGKATGHNVLGGPAVGALIYTTGKVTYTQDAVTGDVTITSPGPKPVNLCDVLS